jgi:hypothetical protein
VYPTTRRIRPVLLPVLPSLLVFGAWWLIRPKEIPAPGEPMRLHPERMAEAWSHVTMNFFGPDGAREQALFDDAKSAIIVVAVTALVWFFWIRRKHGWWELAVTLLPLLLAGGFLLAYLMLPMRSASVVRVPREFTSALFVAGCGADMPKVAWLRLPLIAIPRCFQQARLFSAPSSGTSAPPPTSTPSRARCHRRRS